MISSLPDIPMLTSDRRLLRVDAPRAFFKRDNGMALNLLELAVVSGYDYKIVRSWDLPLIDGKITWPEYLKWRRSVIGESEVGNREHFSHTLTGPIPGHATRARRKRLIADRRDESRHPHDSPTASQSRAESGDTGGNTK
jgi:hypothetical protein